MATSTTAASSPTATGGYYWKAIRSGPRSPVRIKISQTPQGGSGPEFSLECAPEPLQSAIYAECSANLTPDTIRGGSISITVTSSHVTPMATRKKSDADYMEF